MKSRYRKIYVEWWNIKRSTIYRLLGFLVVIAVLGGVFWFLWEKNFFLPAPEINDIPKDAARLISFEGVRDPVVVAGGVDIHHLERWLARRQIP